MASDLIIQALAATRYAFGEPPELGMVTFIDRTKVKPTKRRGKDHFGLVYEKAGFKPVGETKGGLLALQCLPYSMPEAERPLTELEAW